MTGLKDILYNCFIRNKCNR